MIHLQQRQSRLDPPTSPSRLKTLARSAIVAAAFVAAITIGPTIGHADDGLLLQINWYKAGMEHGNPVSNDRFRVNSPEAVMHPEYSKRSETRSSGMLQILQPQPLLSFEQAYLYLELWGGHPGTTNRRVTLNGRSQYPIAAASATHCTHMYPVIPIKPSDLVEGHNAIQFSCDQGTTFWGHFIVDSAAIDIVLPKGHPRRVETGTDDFKATVRCEVDSSAAENHLLSIDVPEAMRSKIKQVTYRARYNGYDENGDGKGDDFHGMTKERRPYACAAESTTAPFSAHWSTAMIPDQQLIDVEAWIEFIDGPDLLYIAPSTSISLGRPATQHVALLAVKEMSTPLWSRASREKTATIVLDRPPTTIQQAQLHIAVWDGGCGTLESNHFFFNDHPLVISEGDDHDVNYFQIPIPAEWLREGANEMRLISDTQHHGIEVLFPGPALAIRYE
jgi:hypothetical protein